MQSEQDPVFSDLSGSDMSLIDEVHRDWRVRKKRRNVKLAILGGALLGIIYCAKLGYDHHQLKNGLELAGIAYAGDNLAHWQKAQSILSDNLQIDGGHSASLSARALVSARMALAESESFEEARVIVSAGSSGSPEALVARGILAWMNGDSDGAWKFAHRAVESGETGKFSPGCGHWFALWLARQVDQVGPTGPEGIDFVHDIVTREQTEVWLQENGDRPGYYRVAASWLFGWGHHNAALNWIEEAREKFPDHLGLVVDEAWMQASLHRKSAAVVELSTKLHGDDYGKSLSQYDRRYLALANGGALLDLGQVAAAKTEFKSVWAKLPAWDLVARRIQLEFVLRHAKPDWIGEWLNKENPGKALEELNSENLGLPESETPWIKAWILFAQGEVAQSLVTLAKLDQQAPRSAYLQGLALVEQQRWSEAWPWIERAKKLFPDRLELRVAQMRANSYLKPGEIDEGSRRELTEVSPYLFRVWSSLGEHLAVHRQDDGIDSEEKNRRKSAAIEAFQQAILYEPWPAEARFQMAQLLPKPTLGRRLREDDFEAIESIRTHLQAAVGDCSKRPRYHEALAEFYNEFGFVDEALEHLQIAAEVENDIVSPNTPLRLIELNALKKIGYGYSRRSYKTIEDELAKKMMGWSDQAFKLGAPASQLAIARGYIALCVRGEALTPSLAELSALIQQEPGNIQGLLLWVRVLAEVQGREAADDALSIRLRSIRRQQQARPRLLLAAMKSSSGDPRQAARLAWGGWRMLLSQTSSAGELLEAAQSVIGHWIAIRQKSGAYRVARDITRILGYHAEAWLLRAELEFAEDNDGAACTSIQQALEHDPEHKKALKLARKCPKTEPQQDSE